MKTNRLLADASQPSHSDSGLTNILLDNTGPWSFIPSLSVLLGPASLSDSVQQLLSGQVDAQIPLLSLDGRVDGWMSWFLVLVVITIKILFKSTKNKNNEFRVRHRSEGESPVQSGSVHSKAGRENETLLLTF